MDGSMIGILVGGLLFTLVVFGFICWVGIRVCQWGTANRGEV